jgi:hypothetical protein
VSIYPPDSTLALRESPSIVEKVPKETVFAEPKKIIDARAATNSAAVMRTGRSTEVECPPA